MVGLQKFHIILCVCVCVCVCVYIYIYIERERDREIVGSLFTTGLRSRIFGCKSNRHETNTFYMA